jgi:hypothetical protein
MFIDESAGGPPNVRRTLTDKSSRPDHFISEKKDLQVSPANPFFVAQGNLFFSGKFTLGIAENFTIYSP